MSSGTPEATPVSIDIAGRLAIVTVDNPPVNALSNAVRQALVAAVATIDADPEVDAAILICAGDTFIAGADIKEFSFPPVTPITADVADAIEGAAKPWIAALHGNALGGGLELALACRYRIAAPGTRLGCPEVNIGLIPGGGATVRLPRIVAPHIAVQMIAEGKPVTADEALGMGLIDRIVTGDLRTGALAFTHDALQAPSPAALTDRPPVATADDPEFVAAEQQLRRKAGAFDARHAAIDAVRDALVLSPEAAMIRLNVTFNALREGAQSRALRYIFFAERSAQRIATAEGVTPRPIRAVGVVGGGTMGAGIAAAFLLAKYPVTVLERDVASLDRGLTAIRAILADSEKRGRIDATEHAGLLAALTGTLDIADFAALDLVIEAVFENIGVKTELFGRLDAAVRPDTILATNTSYLDVSRIAESVRDSSRVVGLHFFSPAHVMKLLEIVRHDRVAPDVLATARALAKRLGKIGIPSGDGEGFVGNRIMSSYRAACETMLVEGALPHEIDVAMTGFGFAMGLFAVQDMSGLDIAWARRKSFPAERRADPAYVGIADRLCEMGRFGRKTGGGYYDYAEGKAQRSQLVEDIVVAESAKKGVTRRAFTSEEILARIIGALQAEGGKVLAEGIADSPEAIDVVLVNGYGFPRWRGGPMHMLRAAAATA
ncbi:MAG TPA: 3-hydroxyacyl-CoA dehydrogenase NAD-binding domain-containing protein [Devosia sp.]|nr:3-hydroxyacyl-CoA dehydrogenase NAD-binding domain-containing protein [Devosia sp.]